MKLVAAKDFFNSTILGIKVSEKAEGFRHKNMVHKGLRFEVGTQENFKDLAPQQQEHVGLLLKHGCAVMDSDENAKNGVISTIDKEAAAELKAHEASLEPVPTQAELIAAAVANALAGLGLGKGASATGR